MAFSHAMLAVLLVLKALAGAQSQSRPALAPAPVTELDLTNQFPLPIYLANYKAKNVVFDWNSAIQWILFASNATNTAPRLLAFTHLVMYEAWRANNASSDPADPSAVEGALGAGFAAMLAMKNQVPLYFDKYDLLVRQHCQNLTDAEISAAENAAKAPVANFLATRLVDGFQDPNPAPVTSGAPGQYVDRGLNPVQPVQQYSHTRPLVLPNNLLEVEIIANFSPPPTLNSSDYNVQYTSVYLYGAYNSTLRSDSQTNTALFWGDQEASLTTTLAQWNRLVLGTLPRNVSLEVTAALMAEYNAGMYDCIVSSFYLKYKYFLWRPITAIREGDVQHEAEPDWEPLQPTPGFPSYPGFAGCYSGFSEKYLANFYGTDARSFIVTTTNVGFDGNLLPTRSYSTFSQAASESAQARYFAGLEFPLDSASARPLGSTIAGYFEDGLEVWDPSYNIPTSPVDSTG